MKKHLLNFWRRFKRNKTFMLVNISGLTLGITCSLIMFLIVKHEISYDNFHENRDQLYRVRTEGMNYGQPFYRIGVPRPLVAAIREEVSGLANLTFFSHQRFGRFEVVRGSGDPLLFSVSHGMVYVEPSFFEMFSWNWLEGNKETALQAVNSVVLDSEQAEKFFPGESSIGKTIKFNNSHDLTVTGVVERRPLNTDFPFEVFISVATLEANEGMEGWGSTRSDDRIYVQLENGVPASRIEEQFAGLVDKHFGESVEQDFLLQSLSEVHFDQLHGNLNYREVRWSLIYVLGAVSFFMVVTACFNFINMSTAMAMKRAKEIGVKKVLGSTRSIIIRSFLTETLSVTLIAVVLSLGLTERLLPTVVNDFTQLQLSLDLLGDSQLIVYLIVLVLFVTILAGFYPAWMISAFQPAKVLRGMVSSRGKGKMSLRRSLVVFQFALSQVFIVCTLIALAQIRFAKNSDLGFAKERLVISSLPGSAESNQDVWKGKLDAISGVSSYSFFQAAPMSGMRSSTDARYENEEGPQAFTSHLKPVDANYLNTFEIDIIAGEGLIPSDTVNRYVVNERFVEKMGMQVEDALGVQISIGGNTAPISGVVDDFHMRTMQYEIDPVALYIQPQTFRSLGVKITAGTTEQTMEELRNAWLDIYPDRDFGFTFFQDRIERSYAQEERFSQLLTIFSGIAIFICGLGLYGLVSYMANQRSKEIGIRKVLGASIQHILAIFSTEFIKLMLIGFFIAAPLAYYGMDNWLSDFVYRTTIGVDIFIVSIGFSLLVTLIITGYRSLSAARVNPVETIRNE